jgi:hypothetical protein
VRGHREGVSRRYSWTIVRESDPRAIAAGVPDADRGVDIGNVADWIKAGCVAVGVGGNLTASAKTGDFKTITSRKTVHREIRIARA